MSSGKNGYEYEAKCPDCRKYYTAYLNVPWTGRAKYPPLTCRQCKIKQGWYYNQTSPRLEFDIVEGRF